MCAWEFPKGQLGRNLFFSSSFLFQGPNIVAIVVPIVVILVVILVAALVILFCVVKKKRQTEGTYRPSAEEHTGARSVEAPNALKLPKEERLI